MTPISTIVTIKLGARCCRSFGAVEESKRDWSLLLVEIRIHSDGCSRAEEDANVKSDTSDSEQQVPDEDPVHVSEIDGAVSDRLETGPKGTCGDYEGKSKRSKENQDDGSSSGLLCVPVVMGDSSVAVKSAVRNRKSNRAE